MSYGFSGTLWDARGHLHLSGRGGEHCGVVARLNLRHADLLTRFRDEIGLGKLHLRQDGQYWVAARASDVTLLAKRLWLYVSPERQEEFARLLPGFRPPKSIAKGLPDEHDDEWVAAMLDLGTVHASRRTIRLRVPGRGTVPLSVVLRFQKLTQAGRVITANRADRGSWECERFQVLHSLVVHHRHLMWPRTLEEFEKALLAHVPPAPPDLVRSVCDRCGQQVVTLFPSYRRGDLFACRCGLRYVDLDTLTVTRSWDEVGMGSSHG